MRARPLDPRPEPPRRRRHWGRALLMALLVVILVPVVAAAILYATVDPNLLKPRIAAAVERATGRTLTLAGPIAWQLAPEPMLTATDVGLSNPPGASRPQMLTVRSVAIRIAWLPLLSGEVQISGLRLIGPDIRLERSAQGVPNWLFTPQARPSGAAASAPAPVHNASPLELRAISILDGVVGWRRASGALVTFPVPTLHLAITGPGTAHATGSGLAIVAGVPVRMEMQAGAGAKAGLAKAGLWPVSLTLAAPGAQLHATARLPAPWQVAGGRADVSVTAPDLAALREWAALPPLHDLRVQAQFTLQTADAATLDGLRVQAGAGDLGAMVQGLRLASFDAAARSATGPIEIVAHGSLGAVPLSVQGSVGPLPALLPGALRPASVALSGTAGAAALALKGSIASPRALTGKDLAFMASIPDLAAFSPRLPALKGVALHTWIGDAPGGIALHDLVLTAPEGDLEGDATVGHAGGRPVVRATLTSRRLDIDALRRAMPRPPLAPSAVAPPTGAPAAPAPAASPAAAPAPARRPSPCRPRR